MIVEPVHYIISLDDIVIRYCRRGVYTKESNGNLDRSNVLKTVLAVLLVFAFLQNWGMSITNEKKIPIEEYNGTVPFATIQDFAGEGSSDYTLTMMGLNMGFNVVKVYFFQNSANYTMPIEEWAEMICDSLGNNKS